MKASFALALLVCLPMNLFAESLTATIFRVDAAGVGERIGRVVLVAIPEGVRGEVDVTRLTPGEHGFHVHERGSCEPALKDGKPVAALAAGAHYDPSRTGKHAGPDGGGHRGDLPRLVADGNGVSQFTFVVPNLKLSELKGRSIMIHEGGDNYSDHPAPLGGGGARIACGVIE